MSNPSQPPTQQMTALQQQQQLRLMQQRAAQASASPQQAPFNLTMPVGVANPGVANAAPSNPVGAAPIRPGGPLSSDQLAKMIQLAKDGKLAPEQVAQLQKLMTALGTQQPANAQRSTPPQPAAPLLNAQATAPTMQRPPPQSTGGPTLPNGQTVNSALQSLAALPEEARAKAIAGNPQLGHLYERYQASRRQQQNQAAANTANAVRPPQAGQQNIRPQGNFGANPVVPNLQLPPNRARNLNASSMPGQGGPGAVQARPNMIPQNRPPPNQAQFQNQANRVGSPAVNLQNVQGSGPSSGGSMGAGMNVPGGPLNRVNSPLSVPSSQTGPSPHPNQAGPRPTLSTGLPAGSTMGTPSLLARSGQGWDEASRAGILAKSDLGTLEGRKRKIREVLEEVEKGEKLEDGVEDLLLEVIDELIDSSTQFAARLAKHRGSSTLDVRDLQLHFERNHNIRIPGMGSDEINQVQSQSARRHPALNQHAQRLQAVREARATHQANVAAEAASSDAK